MIDLQSFNIYLKVGWIKRLFSNLDGDWQKVLLFNLQSYYNNLNQLLVQN
jgi:hypothetical protein